MPRGVVKDYDAERGRGTIEEEAGGEVEVFRNGLSDEGQRVLYRGDVVEFRIGRSKRGGRAAVDVVRIGWEEEPGDGAPREWTF
jgi:cold shock CspA family protein